MTIKRAVSDERLLKILDKYYEKTGKTPGEMITSMVENMENPQIIVPVLGMQGMGKSTLINALLEENILPNEADETTCVPVEIKYGNAQMAKVYFKNGKSEEIERNIGSIASYVDNNNNQGNEKSVARIELFSNSPLLKNGLTIVDLPGVGSLTAANQETTNVYIKNLCTAIFVIPTVPTIRKQEVLFIKSVWSQFPTAMFVQNCWDDESKREIDEAVEYNSKILNKIAGELSAQTPDILAINAYRALKGTVSGDEIVRQQSGIDALSDKLVSLSSEWIDTLKKGIMNRILKFISDTQDNIGKRIRECELESSEIRKRKEDELEEYHNYTRKIKRISEDIEDWLIEQKREMQVFADQSVNECIGNIKSATFALIDQGVTDGEELSMAFKDYQSQFLPELSDKLFDKTYGIKKELERKLSELEGLIEAEERNGFEKTEFDRESEFKFEKALPPLLGIGGGIGGILVGAAIAGPIGAIVGVLIGVAGSLLGELAKWAVRKSRIDAAKKELLPILEKMSGTLKDEIMRSFNEVVKNVVSALDAISDERRENERKMKKDLDNVQPPTEISDLESDLEYLRNNYGGIAND